jgi:hypothetical protein
VRWSFSGLTHVTFLKSIFVLFCFTAALIISHYILYYLSLFPFPLPTFLPHSHCHAQLLYQLYLHTHTFLCSLLRFFVPGLKVLFKSVQICYKNGSIYKVYRDKNYMMIEKSELEERVTKINIEKLNTEHN